MYYFHFGTRDEEGTELADDAAAREQGRMMFGGLIHDGDVSGWAEMEVVGKDGRRVARFTYSSER